MSTRAQAFSLEAFVASILLVTTLAFALQAVAISPNTASTAQAELRGQHVGLTQGIVDGAVENGDLQATVVYWNESSGRFHGADEDEGIYLSENPNTTFGRTMATMLVDQQIRYNIDLHYRGADGERETRRMVEYGTPSHDAVRVTETVTLYDQTHLVNETEHRRENATLGSVENDFYAPDVADDSRIYNVIRVEVIAWRI